MADSYRTLIMQSVCSALADISTTATAITYNTTIATVSEHIKAYNQVSTKDFPACFPIDADETKEHITFSGSNDIGADLTVIITSMLYNRTGVTASARGDLLRDIEKAMYTASQIASMTSIWNTEVTKVTTDQGSIPMFSIHDTEVHFHYTYQSTTGG